MELSERLTGTIDVKALGEWLDSKTHTQRVALIQAMTGKEQARLYDAAKGARTLRVSDMVPPSRKSFEPVHHWGHNSLALFTNFQKRFLRPEGDGAVAGELWGYNHQTMALFTGPGYYVAYDQGHDEVLVDYTRVPPRSGAPSWPAVLPNTARLSRFIYNGTKDTLRGVSTHVTIGRAARDGKDMPNWFVLCRED